MDVRPGQLFPVNVTTSSRSRYPSQHKLYRQDHPADAHTTFDAPPGSSLYVVSDIDNRPVVEFEMVEPSASHLPIPLPRHSRAAENEGRVFKGRHTVAPVYKDGTQRASHRP